MRYLLIFIILLLSGCSTTCYYLEGQESGLVELCDDGTTYQLDCSGEKCTRKEIERTEKLQDELDNWRRKL